MPSVISNAVEFRPLRWFAAVALLCAFAFAGGVWYQASHAVGPQPACMAPR
jgi:hypothetical protein